MKTLSYQVHSHFSSSSSSTSPINFWIPITLLLFFLTSAYIYYYDLTLSSFINSVIIPYFITYPSSCLLNLQIYYEIYHNAISAGILSGCLHALTGPDHLAALLPLCMGRRLWIGSSYGVLWGLGHAVSSVMIGYLGFRMRDLVLDSTWTSGKYSYIGDFVVALTVIVIGVMGLYETHESSTATTTKSHTDSKEEHHDKLVDVVEEEYEKERQEDVNEEEEETSIRDGSFISSNDSSIVMNIEKKNHTVDMSNGSDIESHGGVANVCTKLTSTKHHKGHHHHHGYRVFSTSCCSHLFHRSVICGTVFLNGLALGLSLDGFPSLAPAIVLDNTLVIAFLTSYFFSTILTMSVTSGLIGEASYWITRHFDHNHLNATSASSSKLSDHLARYTSFIACFIGWIWLIIAFMKYMFQSAAEDNNGMLIDDISSTILKFTQHGSGNEKVASSVVDIASVAATSAMADVATTDMLLMSAPNNDNILVEHGFRTGTVLNVVAILLVVIALATSISQEFHIQCLNNNSALGSWSTFLPSILRRKHHKSEDELL